MRRKNEPEHSEEYSEAVEPRRDGGDASVHEMLDDVFAILDGANDVPWTPFLGDKIPALARGHERGILSERLDRVVDNKVKLLEEGLRILHTVESLSLDDVTQELERRGLEFSDQRFLSEAMGRTDFFVQSSIIDIAEKYLNDKDFAEFIITVGNNFRQSYDKGRDSYTALYGEDSDSPTAWLQGYARPFFEKLARVIGERKTDETQESLMDAYTDCLQRFVSIERIEPEVWSESADGKSWISARPAGYQERVDEPDFVVRLQTMQRVGEKERRGSGRDRARSDFNPADYSSEEMDWDPSDAYALTLNHALGGLKTVGGNERTIQFLRTWLEVDPLVNPMHVGEALSSVNPAKGAEAVLPLLRYADAQVREGATRALLRIELGRIGVSAAGVEYLGKRFNLGEYNNSKHSVERITGDGQMGIFDAKGRLFKYFSLEGLGSDDEEIEARVVDFTHETLFTPNPSESAEDKEQRERLLQEFLEHYGEFYGGELTRETGVAWSSLSFVEQGQLLLFYRHADEATKRRTLDFVRTYGEEGFRAFLSLERLGENAGERILEIGEKYPHDLGERGKQIPELIFRKYSELVLSCNKVTEYLRDHFVSWGGDDASARQVTDTMMQRANQLIVEFSSESPDKKISPALAEQLRHKLRRINADLLLFGNSFKVAAREVTERGGQLDFEDIVGTELQSSVATDLPEGDRNEIRRIFQDNRDTYSPSLLAATVVELNGALESPQTRFYLLKHNGAIAGFVRFDENEAEKSAYVASLNIDPSIRGSALGGAFFETMINQYADNGYKLTGVVNPEKKRELAYYQRLGFQVTGKEDHFNVGTPFVRIERLPKGAEMRKAA
ncbi:MAG: GNAT family N-acetyltransferase [Patescibacteria group bacterium]